MPRPDAAQTEIDLAMAVLVGAAGFEPATFWSQTRRATRLRYAPPEPAFDTCFALAEQASLSGL
jgi:hypothetical protein